MALRDWFLRKSPEPKMDDFFIATDGDSKDRILLQLQKAFDDDGTKKTKPEQRSVSRIEPKQLWLAYSMDEMVSRCVNFYVAQVVGPWFDLVDSDEKSIQTSWDFLKKVNFDQKVEELVRDMCVFGHGELEKIQNLNDRMVDLARIDPIYFDYQRNNSGIPIEDSSGKKQGYVFKTLTDKTELGLDEVAYFPLNGVSNDLGTGFVEPLYRVIVDKLNIRVGFKEANWRVGYPLTVAYVGERPDIKSGFPGKKATSAIISRIADKLENLKAKHKLVVPWWVKIEQIKGEKIEQPTLLQYCDEKIVSSFGIPLEIMLSTRGSKAEIDVSVKRDLDRRIKWFQDKKLKPIIEKGILGQLEEQGDIQRAPTLRWREITPEDLNRLSKRYVQYVQFGVLSPEEVRPVVGKLENITLSNAPLEPPEKPEKKPKPMPDDGMHEMAKISRQLEDGEISIEEAIIALKKIERAFPSSVIKMLVKQLIEKIMLKTTDVEKPVEGDDIGDSG